MWSRAIGMMAAFGFALCAQSPPARVSGRVIREDTGEGLAKAIVTLYSQDERTSEAVDGQLVVQTGADGAFVFSGVPDGSYAIEASRNGFVIRPGRSPHFSLGAGQNVTQLYIKFLPAGAISGVVVDQDREPVAAVDVTALRLDYLPGGARQVQEAARATTDDRGSFRLAGLRPGSYFLRAGGQIQHPRDASPLKQSPERTVQYRDTYFPEDAVALETAQPIRLTAGAESTNVQIQVRPEARFRIEGKSEGANKPTQVSYARTDGLLSNVGHSIQVQPGGSFQIRNLPPGEYLLNAEAVRNGFMSSVGYAKVRLVDANERIEFQPGSAARVRGKAVSSVSIAGFRVFLGKYLEAVNVIYLSEIGAEGAFDIRNAPPGEFWFDVRGRRWDDDSLYVKKAECGGADYTTRQIALNLGTQISNCELTIGNDSGTVTGQAMDDDKPVPDLTVVLIPRQADLRRIPRYSRTALTGADGRFQIRGAIPADYYVFAVPSSEDHPYFAPGFADSHRNAALSVTVQPGEVQVVTLKPLP
jgi:protocatechuate 3,4-dioxygenase beta subunit